jgi:hypothetical protein
MSPTPKPFLPFDYSPLPAPFDAPPIQDEDGPKLPFIVGLHGLIASLNRSLIHFASGKRCERRVQVVLTTQPILPQGYGKQGLSNFR